MGKNYRKRKKQICFKKIKFSRNAKMWMILGGAITLLFLTSRITKLDILADIAAGLIFTAPILLAHYQFSKGNFFKKTQRHNVLIYGYIVVILLINFLPSVKIRWLLSFIYSIACGIYLIYRAKEISFKALQLDDGDSILLSIAEIFMLLMITSLTVTTDRNTVGRILTVVLSLILFLPTAYWIKRKLSVSMIKKIGYNIAVLFFAFFMCWQITEGLNYSLDFSKPTAYQTTIIEKEYYNGRGGHSYDFHVYIDGKRKEIDVTSDIYKKYEKGETIEVNIHQGALGMTYYTVD